MAHFEYQMAKYKTAFYNREMDRTDLNESFFLKKLAYHMTIQKNRYVNIENDQTLDLWDKKFITLDDNNQRTVINFDENLNNR